MNAFPWLLVLGQGLVKAKAEEWGSMAGVLRQHQPLFLSCSTCAGALLPMPS